MGIDLAAQLLLSRVQHAHDVLERGSTDHHHVEVTGSTLRPAGYKQQVEGRVVRLLTHPTQHFAELLDLFPVLRPITLTLRPECALVVPLRLSGKLSQCI